jgi:hypothetical protein
MQVYTSLNLIWFLCMPKSVQNAQTLHPFKSKMPNVNLNLLIHSFTRRLKLAEPEPFLELLWQMASPHGSILLAERFGARFGHGNHFATNILLYQQAV